MIDGVKIKKLVKRCDDRGYFMEILRNDDALMEKFGQTAVSVTYPSVIKAFHWHKKQTDMWFVASGMAQIVLYDRREESPTFRETQVIYAGEEDPQLIIIPPGVAHGYRVLGTKPLYMLYHMTESYEPGKPDEERIPFDDPKIGFDWKTKNR